MIEPAVNPNAGSWVITCITTGFTWEVFNYEYAVAAENSNVCKVETAMDYLCRINQEIKEANK